MATEIPIKVELKSGSRTLALTYEGDSTYELGFEFLRVHSPSAEVRGHGPNSAILQVGKKEVLLVHIEPSGNYALKLCFDDGHDSGLYSWDLLRNYCLNKEKLWCDYLKRLKQVGGSRLKTR